MTKSRAAGTGARALGLALIPTMVAAFAASPGVARADGLDGERFAPAAGAGGWLSAETPVVPFHLGYGLGLFLNVADNALVVRDQGTGDVVSRPLDLAFSADLVASLGLWDHLELGVHLPIRIIYDGDPYANAGATLEASAGVGDLRLVPKLRVWGAGSAANHVVVGLALPVSVPTGDDEALRGAGGVTVEPRLLLLGRFGRLGLLGNVGYRWRSEHPEGLPYGDEIAATVAAGVELIPALEIIAELAIAKQVSTDVDGGSTELPAEVLAGVAIRPSPSWTIYGAAGLGVSDGLGAPDLRGILGVRYAPKQPSRDGFGDRDQDGIADKDDECGTEPEDEDGFADHDGCPEPDNDRDGIADDDDECPDLPEEEGGDRDGCPERTYVKVEEGKLIVFGKVRFRSGSAELDPRSEPLLEQVAIALQGTPDLRVRVEGHTDNTGPEELNEELSEQRAGRVRDNLVQRGVSSDRLEIRGEGESRPIAPNRTRAGRAKNRRVELVVID
jgi:OOP family OmpA-OmpF porin